MWDARPRPDAGPRSRSRIVGTDARRVRRPRALASPCVLARARGCAAAALPRFARARAGRRGRGRRAARTGPREQANATSDLYTLPMPAAMRWSRSADPDLRGRVQPGEAPHHPIQVGIGQAEIRTERREGGVPSQRVIVQQLHHRRRDAFGRCARRPDRGDGGPPARPPWHGDRADPPRASHAHVGVQRGSGLEPHQ